MVALRLKISKKSILKIFQNNLSFILYHFYRRLGEKFFKFN